MYKVVFEVVEVSEPRGIKGHPTHVTWPCKVYKVGDKMTIRVPPEEIVKEETDAVCLSALSAIMPLAGALLRGGTEAWDYIDRIEFFSCPDAERPVIFQVKRVRQEPPAGP
jgi:uncharacterized repeat protein (TIGR04076 family)